MVKKTKNPFKIWGSYVIPVLVLIVFYKNILSLLQGTCTDKCASVLILCLSCQSSLMIALTLIIIGFVIGYGIHLAIKKWRK